MKVPRILTQTGLNRRLRRHFISGDHILFVTCQPGFENELKAELADINAELRILSVEKGGIEVAGHLGNVQLINLLSRIATRVVLRIHHSMIKSYPELYDKTSRIPWEYYLGLMPTATISATSRESRLHHTQQLQSSVLNGISTHYNPFNVPLNASKGEPDLILTRFYRDDCQISLDTSGMPLFKRGYIERSSRAPIRSTTVSAMLRHFDLSKYSTVFNPFCGSGTLLTETLWLLSPFNMARHRDYAFQHHPYFKIKGTGGLFKNLSFQRKMKPLPELIGLDTNKFEIHNTLTNLNRIGVKSATIIEQDFFEYPISQPSGPGLFLANLPYGKRISTGNEMEGWYHQLSAHINTHYPTFDLLLIANGDAKLEQRIHDLSVLKSFNNGGLHVKAWIRKL